jgi:hypothetical protein
VRNNVTCKPKQTTQTIHFILFFFSSPFRSVFCCLPPGLFHSADVRSGGWGSYGSGLADVHVAAEVALEMGVTVRSAGSVWSAVFGPLWEATSWVC